MKRLVAIGAASLVVTAYTITLLPLMAVFNGPKEAWEDVRFLWRAITRI